MTGSVVGYVPARGGINGLGFDRGIEFVASGIEALPHCNGLHVGRPNRPQVPSNTALPGILIMWTEVLHVSECPVSVECGCSLLSIGGLERNQQKCCRKDQCRSHHVSS